MLTKILTVTVHDGTSCGYAGDIAAFARDNKVWFRYTVRPCTDFNEDDDLDFENYRYLSDRDNLDDMKAAITRFHKDFDMSVTYS